MSYSPQTKPSDQIRMEDYYFINMVWQGFSDKELHVRYRTLKFPINTLCGKQINRPLGTGSNRLERKATAVNEETMQEFENKTCSECVDLWKAAQIVEE